jgi:hypothetical protein
MAIKKENNATVIEKYTEYRKVSKELNHKIMDKCLDPDVFKKSARLLGATQGEVLVLDNEDEMSVLMDFALREYKVNKQTTVEIYGEKIGGENEIEKEILDAFVSSYTSLFRIISISKTENSLILEDILICLPAYCSLFIANWKNIFLKNINYRVKRLNQIAIP